MANTLSNTVGLLINSPNPLPDATVESITSVGTVAAAGTTQATATALPYAINTITNNTAANGVILPVGTKTQFVEVYPALVTNAPKVYPPVGGTINFGTVNASVAATAQKGARFTCLDSTGLNWGLVQSA